MSQRLRKIVTPLMAILGVQAWLLILHGDWGRNSHVLWLGAAVVVGCIPPVNRLVWRVLRRLRHPTPIAAALAALALTLAAAASLGQFAVSCHRDLFPTMHDEFQFLIQARMLAHGRLWMPGHPLVDSFDTFYVLIQPKYAAQSFPGTAFFYVPAIWLNIAAWKWAIGIAACCVGMMYLAVTELADGLAGVLAAALLARLSLLRYVSTMVLAQTPALLLGLACIWVYLLWRRNKTAGRALVLGAVVGWMLITRPADALIFALPVGLSLLVDLNRLRHGMGRTIVAGMIGAAPWVAVQLIFNVGVTGHLFTTPFGLYNQRDQPGLVYSIAPAAPTARPMTRVPEKRAYYFDSVRPHILKQRPDRLWYAFSQERLPYILQDDLPQPILLAALPMGLLAWGRRRAWVLGLGLPLFLLIYTPYPIFTLHYSLVAAASAVFTVVLAPKAISVAWPRSRQAVWTIAAIFVAGLWLTRTVGDIYPLASSIAHPSIVLGKANQRTAELAAQGRPAVVLFRRDRALSAEAEPVYNLDAPWPDDELVIRAHDRGRENRRLFLYYSTHGPDRAIYRFDESQPDKPLVYLGMASDLAKRSAGQ